MKSDKDQSSHSDDSTTDIEDGVVASIISLNIFESIGPTWASRHRGGGRLSRQLT